MPEHKDGPDSSYQPSTDNRAGTGSNFPNNAGLPSISLPKGGGAIRGMGEKFAANPVTGTGSMTVPIATSPGRSGFGPQLTLSYESGAGNGPFGFGWNLALPSITRKTDKGIPRYLDDGESDVFILSGAEDLVRVLEEDGAPHATVRKVDGVDYRVERYRPRIEGLFSRIERWTNIESGEAHWHSISQDNSTTIYGKTAESRIVDPSDAFRVFSWLISETHDDKGNAIVFQYQAENSVGIDTSQVHERNRTSLGRAAYRYLKRIKYGNRVSRLVQPDLSEANWMFEVVFDYGEHDADAPMPNDPGDWLVRNDPFSSYRAGFEIRTYRLCRRVLMFHHFPGEVNVGQDCLVRSTDFVYSHDVRPDNPTNPIYSFIVSVTQKGYQRTAGGYESKSMPPLDFSYSDTSVDEEVHLVDEASLENLPFGADGTQYQWVDLDSEGLPGILSEQADAWFYKRNVSSLPHDGEDLVARFEPVELVRTKPSLADLSSGQQLMDLAGEGQLCLVQFGEFMSGFYERDQTGHWQQFVPFVSRPEIDWNSPNLKFVDLNGDGHAD
ncbi:MAG: hypothetical protein ND866_11175, partial [Pyrinomonadaceae bacterium]|nr:hypothetical protein [Pyrinomonadaceae bacterium]